MKTLNQKTFLLNQVSEKEILLHLGCPACGGANLRNFGNPRHREIPLKFQAILSLFTFGFWLFVVLVFRAVESFENRNSAWHEGDIAQCTDCGAKWTFSRTPS